jgi:hypothetical protein
MKIEKPLVIKWQNFQSPSSVHSIKLSPLQASTTASIIVLTFFWGVHMIMRRKWVSI